METWDLYDAAVEAGVGGEAEELVSTHEQYGAERAERLPHADELAENGHPAAVCSLNCEAACRTALDREGLLGHVAAVVGRDSVPAKKPDPEPLLAAVEALDLPPERVLFVGDSESDAVTAERAGTGFRYVQRPTRRA
ncbi:HAD family hydrolase [Halospeciosus flavus]|uniref:HAD family hydrolase n=1 Tax=Halospeciosus flavus TaxID=3032283 RepID=UPI003615A060